MADALASLFMPAGLRPFDNRVDTPRDMGLGGLSTEYLATNDAPDGGYWNIPQIWWNGAGPVYLPHETAQSLAMDYEALTRRRFPRFVAPDAGAMAAANRSRQGGGQVGPLASLFEGGN